MEDTIAEALSKLTGETYEVEIAAIDLAPKGVGIVGDTTDIRLRVTKPMGAFIRERFVTPAADKPAGNPS